MATGTVKQIPKEPPMVKMIKLIESIASGASEELMVAGAKKITLFFKRSNHAAGVSTFDVDVSADGDNYVDYNKLITNVANTNVQTPVRAATVALVADGMAFATIDPVDTFYSIKVNVVETTDGTHECWAVVEF